MTRKINPRISDDGELQDGKFCLNCGVINSPSANYCRKCGAYFTNDELRNPRRSVVVTSLPLRSVFAVVAGFIGVLMLSLVLFYPSSPHSITPLRTPIPFRTIAMYKPPTATVINTTPFAAKSAESASTETKLVLTGVLTNDLDGSCIMQMTNADIAVNYKASGTGQGIALISDDGSQLCRLTLVTGDQSLYDYEPHWLPNGRIAFNSTRNKQATSGKQMFMK